MIIKEFLETRSDGVKLYRHYSDKGVMLRQVETGILYSEPIDIEEAPYTYEETDELIEGNGEHRPTLAPDEISAEEFMALVEEAL
jgi:hypothetical protein